MKEQDRIKESDSWNQFFASGKVEDYLHYVAGCRKEASPDDRKTKWVGDSSHAGVYRGNGNHIETDAYR